MIGHTLSAAGAIEAIVSVLTLTHQRIPPTINYLSPDPAVASTWSPTALATYTLAR
jgi:3-oxoacyl-[acyl-carrier-protein] synthase II